MKKINAYTNLYLYSFKKANEIRYGRIAPFIRLIMYPSDASHPVRAFKKSSLYWVSSSSVAPRRDSISGILGAVMNTMNTTRMNRQKTQKMKDAKSSFNLGNGSFKLSGKYNASVYPMKDKIVMLIIAVANTV
jgi:hypothetical protein